MWMFLHECDWCKTDEERLFNDSWTGMELCLRCLGTVADYVTNSPASEGDNLAEVLMVRAGDFRPWYEVEDEGDEYSYAGNESPDPQHGYV